MAAFFTCKIIAIKRAESESIDFDNPYLKLCSKDSVPGLYELAIKPAMDRAMAFTALVVLSPLMFGIAFLVALDDPGPVFFTQKRVGVNGHYFMLHKFRTMKVSAPHDVPTHQMYKSAKYITRVGRVLRRTSLDELPQIWDIFRGKMSVVGPRPALWNQEDLINARQEAGANGILPGLTGLAQIKGRDELEISEKAYLDGEYARILRAGGTRAFVQDCRALIATLGSVAQHDGVVEGGTGSLPGKMESFWGKASPADAGFEEYGYKKTFHIDKTARKRVLIAGAGSYIGESFQRYTDENYPNIEITTVDMVGGTWKGCDFHGFDTVFYVAGIAHADVGKVSQEEKTRYYAVNCDLAVETCRKAKADGVKQFIFMSSMIVYGDAPYRKGCVIDIHTIPSPANFYGDSKWQADKGVRALATDFFHVAVLRPPMVYGRGCKGNYQTLAKLARKLPVFPDTGNSRSVLYIGNLCEFVALLTLSGEGGVYFPQNGAYVSTSGMAGSIAYEAWHRLHITKLLNPAVGLAERFPGKTRGFVHKAFGNRLYAKRLSQYEGLDYQKYSFAESIALTEGTENIESEDYTELA